MSWIRGREGWVECAFNGGDWGWDVISGVLIIKIVGMIQM